VSVASPLGVTSVAVTRATESPTESVKYLSDRYLDCLELAEDPPTSEVI
jgi:hypothetical protein